MSQVYDRICWIEGDISMYLWMDKIKPDVDKTRFELLSIFGKRISEKRDSWLHGRKNS